MKNVAGQLAPNTERANPSSLRLFQRGAGSSDFSPARRNKLAQAPKTRPAENQRWPSQWLYDKHNYRPHVYYHHRPDKSEPFGDKRFLVPFWRVKKEQSHGRHASGSRTQAYGLAGE